jgi:hypothetical protein
LAEAIVIGGDEIRRATECFVAVALVSYGTVAAIALEECDRGAAGLGPQNRAARLAGIEQAPAPAFAEEQGSRTDG